MSNNFAVGMTLLFIVFVFAFVLSLAFAVATYVLQGIGLYKMAKNTGDRYAWCAWVPVGHQFLVGHLADRYNRTQGKNSKFGPLLLIFYLVSLFGGGFIGLLTGLIAGFSELDALDSGFFSVITVLLVLLSYGIAIALTVIYYVASYRLYQDYEPSNAALYTVLAVFSLDFIAKFLCRNNVPVGVAGRVYPKQPKYAVVLRGPVPPVNGQGWTAPPQDGPTSIFRGYPSGGQRPGMEEMRQKPETQMEAPVQENTVGEPQTENISFPEVPAPLEKPQEKDPEN